MFYGCTNLESAPDLPAEGLKLSCYAQMFYGCTKIKSLKCLATWGFNWSSCVSDMLTGTATSGTFYYAKGTQSDWNSRGCVPSGWTWQVVE